MDSVSSDRVKGGTISVVQFSGGYKKKTKPLPFSKINHCRKIRKVRNVSMPICISKGML